ncbi:MAG: class I SAM-dependent methyltransferase [Pseudomonadota bacterium]|nr:class I SAM-dependent methyltransferase [Pseudomonadota bacterium]
MSIPVPYLVGERLTLSQYATVAKFTNPYGDHPIPTTGNHGLDIGGQRTDELDQSCLDFARTLQSPAPTAVDLGCGQGRMSIALAELGVRCWLVDQAPPSPVLQARITDPASHLRYLQCEIGALDADSLPTSIDILFSQRFIHYLAYPDAVRVLNALSARLRLGARLFLSASGLHSELGEDYPAHNAGINHRMALLSEPMAQKHQIHVPVCLYTTADLAALSDQAGLFPVRIWRSPFGNIKGIFEKP